MRHPQRFLKARPCGVLNGAMILVVCLYSVAGFLGYLRFGNATDGSITLNLPNDLYVYNTRSANDNHIIEKKNPKNANV